MSDFEKFKENLSRKEKLSSSLIGKNISNKEYEHHALNVWNKFEMKTMKDYHGWYLKCDALLIADVFEKCKNKSLKNYGLCPSHYLSASYSLLFTRYSLHFTCYLLLFTRYSLLFTCYSLLFTRYLLLCYFLLVTCYFLLVTRYFLLITRFLLLRSKVYFIFAFAVGEKERVF